MYSHFSATDWITPFGLIFVAAIFTAWIFALPTMAGLAVHRIGCFLAGCCWGHIVLGNLTVTQLQCIILAFSVVLLPRFRRSVVS